jgi:ABC-type multidrug transport system ATPase subunit
MKITLSNAGKRFNREWIFRRADLQFQSSVAYAITGPNGSGKSTLLQSIGGMLQLSEGTIRYENVEGELRNEEVYQAVSFCAPYLDVIEEMNLMEFLKFHQQFKSFLPGLDAQKIISILGLEASAQKLIRNYSSGMKQRVKLAQAILSNTSVVLLDEPCSNLDAAGIALYHLLIEEYCKDRLVIVSSNDVVEYKFCKEIIDIKQYK